MYRNILLFFVVIFGLLGHSRMMPSQKVVSPTDNCAAKLGYNASLIDDEIRNLSRTKLIDPKIKCMMLCLWNENKMANANGELNITTITSKIPANIPERDDVVKGFSECSKQDKKDDPCETFSNALLCLLTKPAFCRFIHLGKNCENFVQLTN